MIYGSVCSGIEAATVAWQPLGWKAAWFSEIEPFPSAVLKHHYPEVPNHGDFTKIKADTGGAIDLLVGGTPCQSFSVAGKRKGLDDPRGDLTLEYLALVSRKRPRWLVWENVPGVLSIDGGRTFGTFLGILGQLGYGFAYRVLDAQYFGVPQRRRRVFVVGYLGDWRRAAAVLFESHILSWHPEPGKAKGEDASAFTPGGFGDYSEGIGTLRAHKTGGFCGTEPRVVPFTVRMREGKEGGGKGPLVSSDRSLSPATGNDQIVTIQNTMLGRERGGPKGPGFRVDGQAFTVDTKGPQAVAFDLAQITSKTNQSRVAPELPAATLAAGSSAHVAFVPTAGDSTRRRAHSVDADNITSIVQVQWASGGGEVENPTSQRLRSGAESAYQFLRTGTQVRRFTPIECERLQGFPDDYTLVPYKGKPASDSPRYHTIGNSMAVPVMQEIGRRIQMLEDLITEGVLNE